MRTRFFFLFLATLALGVSVAFAQGVGAIELGGTVQSAVSADNSAPSFFFETTGAASLLARVQVSPDGLVPVLLAADSANRVISTVTATEGMRVLESQFNVPSAGRYFVQVQGLNGTQGVFSLTLLDLNAMTPTPTTAPPTATALPAQPLALNTPADGMVSAEQPEARFTLPGSANGLAVRLSVPPASAAYPGFVLLNEGGTQVAVLSSGLRGGTLILPAGSYTLVAAHSGGEAQSFSVLVLDAITYAVLESEALARLNGAAQPTATATQVVLATVTPVPPPADVDVLLRWDSTALVATNVSGSPVNLTGLSLSGNNRSVDTDYWARSNPFLNLAAIGPGVCVGLRPLAYPDAPPLPPGCDDLGGWWSADIVYVWGGDTFDVYLSGVLAATCTVSAGQCGIDLVGG